MSSLASPCRAGMRVCQFTFLSSGNQLLHWRRHPFALLILLRTVVQRRSSSCTRHGPRGAMFSLCFRACKAFGVVGGKGAHLKGGSSSRPYNGSLNGIGPVAPQLKRPQKVDDPKIGTQRLALQPKATGMRWRRRVRPRHASAARQGISRHQCGGLDLK